MNITQCVELVNICSSNFGQVCFPCFTYKQLNKSTGKCAYSFFGNGFNDLSFGGWFNDRAAKHVYKIRIAFADAV